MANKIQPVPVPTNLLNWLEAVFPDKLPEASAALTIDQLYSRMGEQQVIRFLRRHHDLQNKTER